MHRKPVFSFVSGIVMFVGIGALHLLDSLHGLKYVSHELPGFYAWVISKPVEISVILVASCFILAGAVELRRQRQRVQVGEVKQLFSEALPQPPVSSRSVTGITHGDLSPVAGRDVNLHLHTLQEAAAVSAPFVMLEFAPAAQLSEFQLVNSGEDAFGVVAESNLTQVGSSQLKLVFNTKGIGVLRGGTGKPVRCELYRQEAGQLIGCGLGESTTSEFLWHVGMMIFQAEETTATFTVDVSCEDKQRETHQTSWVIEFSARRDNPIVRRA